MRWVLHAAKSGAIRCSVPSHPELDAAHNNAVAHAAIAVCCREDTEAAREGGESAGSVT